MESLLLEKPLLLGVMLLTALAIAIGYWNRQRTTGSRNALLAIMVLAPVLMAVQHWVQTDRERLEATVRQMSAWVEGGQIPRIVSLFDPAADFGGGHGRDDFQQQIERLLEKYDIQDAGVGGFMIELNDGRATLQCAAHCRIDTRQGAYPVRSRWKIHFKLLGKEWKITNLQPISIMDRPYDSFFEIN